MVPLMHLGFHGSPSLGVGSRWTLAIFSVCDGLVSALRSGRRRLQRYGFVVAFIEMWCLFCGLFDSILLTIHYFGCGCKWQGDEEMLESFHDYKSWVGITTTVTLLTSRYFSLLVFGTGIKLVRV